MDKFVRNLKVAVANTRMIRQVKKTKPTDLDTIARVALSSPKGAQDPELLRTITAHLSGEEVGERVEMDIVKLERESEGRVADARSSSSSSTAS